MKKIVVMATSGENREDGNIYYSRYFVVDNGGNDELKFDEFVFNRTSGTLGDALELIKSKGYTVEDLEVIYSIVNDISDEVTPPPPNPFGMIEVTGPAE